MGPGGTITHRPAALAQRGIDGPRRRRHLDRARHDDEIGEAPGNAPRDPSGLPVATSQSALTLPGYLPRFAMLTPLRTHALSTTCWSLFVASVCCFSAASRTDARMLSDRPMVA